MSHKRITPLQTIELHQNHLKHLTKNNAASATSNFLQETTVVNAAAGIVRIAKVLRAVKAGVVIAARMVKAMQLRVPVAIKVVAVVV